MSSLIEQLDKALDSLSRARTALDDPDGLDEDDHRSWEEGPDNLFAINMIDDAMRLLGADQYPLLRTEKSGWWIHKHEIAQAYGGPEEGGWWYETGVPVAKWEPPKFDDKEAAYARCRELNAREQERATREEEYEYTSVLAHLSTHYAYSVEDTPEMEAYPSVRPHYE